MFKSKMSLGVLALTFCALSSSVFAVNSLPFDVVATVNSSLAISLSTSGAQVFDPSGANNNVKIGQATISASSGNFRVYLYHAPANTLDQSDTSTLRMTQITGVVGGNPDTIPYQVKLVADAGSVALDSSAYVSSYGSSWSVTGAHAAFTDKTYSLFVKNDAPAAAVRDGQYKDTVVLSAVAL